MSSIRPPTLCGLFKPGHTPHYIQIGKAVEDRDNAAVAGRFSGLHSETSIEIEVDGVAFHVWNHECERLADAAALADGAIQYQPKWGLLWVPATQGRYAFCVVRHSENFVACPARIPTGRPSELLDVAGGFTIPLTSRDTAV
jgi:hypothetical protein